jgi:signal transduction histidine kinase
MPTTAALPPPVSTERVVRWARRPNVTDMLLVGALVAVGLLTAAPAGYYPDRAAAVLLVSAPLPVLLLVRRRYPVAVCVALALANLLIVTTGYPPLGGVLALAAALYSLGAYRDIQVAVAVGFALLVALPVGFWFGASELAFRGAGYVYEPAPVVVLPLFVPLGVGILTRQYRQRNAPTARELELQQAGQAETERRVLLEERAAIARDLHDSVAHHVNLMVIQAETGPDLVERGTEDVLNGFRLIGDTGRRALAELDRTLAALRDDSGALLAPQPGLADLPALVEDTAAQGLAVDLVTLGQPRPADAGVELAAYRIVQESLTNVVRHAEASAATVTVEYARDGLAVQVADRGRGFDPAQARPDRAGNGLAGMRERARVHGGTLAVASAPGAGTMVSAWLPLPEVS